MYVILIAGVVFLGNEKCLLMTFSHKLTVAGDKVSAGALRYSKDIA
jgi:hypothetical protein